jgi:hypothetical protein
LADWLTRSLYEEKMQPNEIFLMNKFLLILSVIGVISLQFDPPAPRAAGMTSPSASNAPASGELTPLQMQTDFDTLRKALEEAHAGSIGIQPRPK